MKTVGQLVDELFHTHRRPDGREYTYQEICTALDGAIEPSQLSRLRNGKVTNPGRETLLALCRFFQVRPSYFFPELEQLPPPAEATQPDALQVALRSSGLRPDVQAKLEDLIQTLKDQHS